MRIASSYRHSTQDLTGRDRFTGLDRFAPPTPAAEAYIGAVRGWKGPFSGLVSMEATKPRSASGRLTADQPRCI